MSISIAEGCLSSRTDHLVALRRESIEALLSLSPLAEICIAETCIEVSQVTSLCAAVLASNLSETYIACAIAIECLLEHLVLEVSLSLAEQSACLVLTRTCNLREVTEHTCDDNDQGYHCDNNSLLILHEEGLTHVKALDFLSLYVVVCHFLFFIFLLFLQFRMQKYAILFNY